MEQSGAKAFLRNMLTIALPLAFQFLVTSTVGLMDVIMIGRLGDENIAAAGSANQYVFLLTIFSFGIYSGSGVFLSQFWGAKDLRNTRRTVGMMYALGLTMALLYSIFAFAAPSAVIRIFTDDQMVIDLGADYLRILAVGFLPYTVSLALSISCRCTGNIRLPVVASICSVITNIAGNALLIYGLLGFPAMGLKGAAVATVIARFVECAILLVGVYAHQLPPAASPRELFDFDRPFVRRYIKISWPVLLNEAVWSLGNSMYLVIFGLLGTSVLAAVQISNTVSQILLVFVRGASDASGIMVGNKIGSGDEKGAMEDSRRFMVFMPILGAVIGCLLMLLKNPILSVYSVSEETLRAAGLLLTLQAVSCIPRALNSPIIVGICRCGGDTTFACLLDILPVWLLAVPLGFLSVHFGAPLWVVTLCIMSEEIVKPLFGVPRVLSNKWLHNVVSDL